MEALELPGLVVPAPPAPIAETHRDVAYATRDGRDLHADLVRPASATASIVLVHGEPALEDGGRFWSEDRRVKDSGPIQGWSFLLVANGFTVLAPNVRSSAGFRRPDEVDDDVDAAVAALARLGGPCDRIGVLAFSGGTPFALALARRDARVRAIVTMYGALDLGEPALSEWFPGATHPVVQRWDPSRRADALPPHLHVWPERDWLPNGVERYRAHAREAGLPFEVLRHPTGRHGFDFIDDDDRSREIIARIVGFFHEHLGTVPG